jgi:hypothetical protein
LLTDLISAADAIVPYMDHAARLAKSWTVRGKPTNIMLPTLVYSLAVIYEAQTDRSAAFSGKQTDFSPFEKFVSAVAEAAIRRFKPRQVKNAVRRHAHRRRTNEAYRVAFQKDVVASQVPSTHKKGVEAMAHLDPAHVVGLVGV